MRRTRCGVAAPRGEREPPLAAFFNYEWLHYEKAATAAQLSLTNFLGVDLSKANLKGVTPLMTAAGSGGVEQVRMLLAAKPDLSLKDSRGWTALDYALNRSDASR